MGLFGTLLWAELLCSQTCATSPGDIAGVEAVITRQREPCPELRFAPSKRAHSFFNAIELWSAPHATARARGVSPSLFALPAPPLAGRRDLALPARPMEVAGQ